MFRDNWWLNRVVYFCFDVLVMMTVTAYMRTWGLIFCLLWIGVVSYLNFIKNDSNFSNVTKYKVYIPTGTGYIFGRYILRNTLKYSFAIMFALGFVKRSQLDNPVFMFMVACYLTSFGVMFLTDEHKSIHDWVCDSYVADKSHESKKYEKVTGREVKKEKYKGSKFSLEHLKYMLFYEDVRTNLDCMVDKKTKNKINKNKQKSKPKNKGKGKVVNQKETENKSKSTQEMVDSFMED